MTGPRYPLEERAPDDRPHAIKGFADEEIRLSSLTHPEMSGWKSSMKSSRGNVRALGPQDRWRSRGRRQ